MATSASGENEKRAQAIQDLPQELGRHAVGGAAAKEAAVRAERHVHVEGELAHPLAVGMLQGGRDVGLREVLVEVGRWRIGGVARSRYVVLAQELGIDPDPSVSRHLRPSFLRTAQNG